MDLYTAFMRTADRVGKNPGTCHLCVTDIPASGRDGGCVLGWVAYEMGLKMIHADGMLRHLGLEHFTDFSTRMININEKTSGYASHGYSGWYRNPEAIRTYAERYLEKPKPTRDPGLDKLLAGLDSGARTHMIESPTTGDVR